MNILVINPGSTSTKVAVYADEEMQKNQTLTHSREELSKYAKLMDQLDFRYELIIEFLREAGYEPGDLDCVMSRGGSPPNVRSGATVIDENLTTALRERPKEPHPASLGPIIAARIAKEAGGIPAYIYDPITTDEMNPLARMFGVKGIEQDSMCHVLNTRAMGISVAKEIGKPFADLNLIVVHVGGGNSVSLYSDGRLTDVYPTDLTAFSAERCGVLRGERIVQLCQIHGFDTVIDWMHGKGGFASLLGTNDLREVEQMIDRGDEDAILCMKAMAYQISKSITALFSVVYGKIDGVVFTGGGARWPHLMDEIKGRIAFLNAPIFMRPGENEIKALAEGALRVMRGEETAHIYEG